MANRLALAWLVISAAAIGLMRTTTRSVNAQQLATAGGRLLPDALPEPTTLLRNARVVTARGWGGEIAIERTGDTVLADIGSDWPRLRVVGDATEARLVAPDGETRFRIAFVDASKATIFDAAGNQLWRVKRQIEEGEETFKLYDGNDTVCHRTKVKADSFNVYAAGSERTAKGKPRDGGFETRPLNGGPNVVVAGDVAGDVALRQAAVMSLPVEPAVRVLLWVLAGN